MRRYGSLIIAVFGTLVASAQLFTSDRAILEISPDALLYIRNGDLENSGSIYLSGEIELEGNLLNEDLIESPPGQLSTFSVQGNWTNNSAFNAGNGLVTLNGGVQQIGGAVSTRFNRLLCDGSLLDIKHVLTDIEIDNELDLKGAVLHVGDNTATIRSITIPIKHSGGFIETSKDGRFRVLVQSSGTSPFMIPFGSNPVSPLRRQFALINPPAGNYACAFIGSSPSDQGMDPDRIGDSICRVYSDHFWYVEGDRDIRFSVERVSGEEAFDRISSWGSGQWEQMAFTSTLSPIPQIWNSGSLLAGEGFYFGLNSQAPYVSIEPDLQVYRGQSRTIRTQVHLPDGGTLTWDPADQLNCSNCTEPEFEADHSELLVLRANNDICSDEDELFIEVLVRDEVFTQNAFTPNGDGRNDLFDPVLVDHEELEFMEVYNRWGEKIFEGTSGWNGTYKGEIVPPGVYMYKFTVRRKFGEQYHKLIHNEGTVQVLR